MSNTKMPNAIRRKVRRGVLVAVFPLLVLPFVYFYAIGGWWLLTVLDGFPGGFFRRHPDLTVAVVAIFACYLFIVTAQAVWDKVRASF